MNFEIRNISILVVKIILCFKISQNVILGIHDLELPHKWLTKLPHCIVQMIHSTESPMFYWFVHE